MHRRLTCDEFVAALDSWRGRMVVVRVVSEVDELIAVFCGELGGRSADKHPALFWPLNGELPHLPQAERPGIYLHPPRFESAAAHPGEWVLELRQDDVTLNIRRL